MTLFAEAMALEGRVYIDKLDTRILRNVRGSRCLIKPKMEYSE
jgi:hypothetical protein